MIPVFGWEVEEGEQSLPVLCQACDRLVVLGAVFVGEHVDGSLGGRAGRRSINLAKICLHVDLEPPFASYTFRHALVQDAAYASLLRDRRRAIHLRVAEEMVKDTSGETAEPQLIARHVAEAGDPDRAIEYYAKAA